MMDVRRVLFVCMWCAVALATGCAGGSSDPAAPSPQPNNDPMPDCLRDSDCGGTQFCTDGICVDGECTRDADCDDGEICLIAAGVCVTPQCLQNSECPEGQFCDPEDRKCKDGCQDNANCPEGTVCNPNTQRCEANNECEMDGDCDDQEICRENKCFAVECTRDAHCTGPGEICDLENNKCQAAEGFCDDDDDCEGDDKCDLERNICVEVGCGECPEGTTCNEEVGECRECEQDADCGEGGECNLTDHTCVDARCTEDADCPGQICNTITGKCEDVQECVADSFEANDVEEDAREIGEGSFEGLSICEGDEDWFAFQVGAGDGITIEALFDHQAGNIDLDLFDPNNQRIGAATSNTDDERIFSENLPLAGTYRLRVFGVDNAEAGYALNLTIEENEDPQCQDDGFEDNDDLDTAVSIAPGTFDDMVICPGDADLFKLSLERGDTLTATINFAHDAGDLDLTITNTNGDTLVESISQTDNETVTTAPIEVSGDYIVSVLSLSPAVGNTYQLVLSRTEAPNNCEDDTFEPNNTRDDARSVAPDLFGDLRMCAGNEDFYAIGLNAGDDIRVELDFSHNAGDLDLQLFQPEVEGAIAESRSRTDGEEVGFTDVPVSGVYTIRVVGAAPEVETSYLMLIERTEAPNECEDDELEDNDNDQQARAVQPGEQIGQICSGDEDWFSIQANASGSLNVDLEFDNNDGNLDLEVFGPGGESLGVSANTDTDTESIDLSDLLASGTYLVRVHGPRGAEGIYSVDIQVGAPVCPDDDDEDNDDPDNATLVDLVDTIDFTARRVCTGDDDWYAVDLSAGDGLTATIFFDDEAGDLDLHILDEEGTRLASSISVNDNEEATVGRVEEGGLFFVRVFGFIGAEGQYDLTLDRIDGGTDCDDDRQEPNDTAQRARTVTPGTLDGLHLCPFDEDFFAVELAEGEILETTLNFIDADGDVDVEILDPNEARLGVGFSVTDDEFVAVRARTSGLHIVRVFSFSDDIDTDYSMTLNILGPDNCLEDDFEENDDQDNTAFITIGNTENLGLCQLEDETEEDWFEFTTFSQGTLSVTILFSHEVGDLDLEIFNEGDAMELDSSLGVRDSETVTVEDAPPGTYQIRIFSVFRDRLINEYDISVELAIE